MSSSGPLLLVGGREERSAAGVILQRFVTLCGGPPARIVVLTTASKDPDKHRRDYRRAFRGLAANVSVHHTRRRRDADGRRVLEAVEQADGVYFTGGGQFQLVSTIGGTRLDHLLRERHAAGLPVGGTSAGASALTAVMVARGRGKEAPRHSSVELAAGLGLLPDVLVDQHFRERDRLGRLLSAVLRNPRLLGFGIDENTAVEIAGRQATVLGQGTLTIVDGAELSASSLLESIREDLPLAFAGMRLHVLQPGWRFDLRRRLVEIPDPDLL